MGRGFIYYLPGAQSMSAARVGQLGLNLVAEGASLTSAGMTAGPDKGAGQVFGFHVPGREEPDLHAKVTWEAIPGSKVWLGLDQANPPGPTDLARSSVFPGYDLELGDHRMWTVPILRMLGGGTNLPRRRRWLGGERWSDDQIVERYRETFERACAVFETLTSAAAADAISVDVSTDLAARALALNYRLGPAEISALGLFDSRSEAEVVKAALQIPVLLELLADSKKNEVLDTHDGTPGASA